MLVVVAVLGNVPGTGDRERRQQLAFLRDAWRDLEISRRPRHLARLIRSTSTQPIYLISVYFNCTLPGVSKESTFPQSILN